MKDLPLRSTASMTTGIWLVHQEDDVIIRFWGSTMSGQERVYINNDLVSTKTVITRFTSIHRFEYDGSNYDVEFLLKPYAGYVYECNIYRDGHLLKSFICGYDNTGGMFIREEEENEEAVVRAIERFVGEGIKKLEEFEIKASIRELQKALAIDPDDPEAHFYLACGYSLMEETENGFHHLEKAIASGLKGKNRILTVDQLAYLRMRPGFEEFKQNHF